MAARRTHRTHRSSDHLADHLAELVADLSGTEPGRLHLIEGPRSAPVAVPDRAIDEPADLVGVVAPLEALGVAVVLGGTARADERPDRAHLPGPDPSAGAPEPGDSVVVASLVLRTGIEAAAVRTASGPAHPVVPEDGFLRDVLRRVVGRPTPPVDLPTSALAVSMWLDDVLDRAADPDRAGTVASWRSIALLAPGATELLADDEVLVPDLLAAAIVADAGATSWERLHRLGSSEGPHADLVAWMDPPFFARWTLSGYRPVTDVLDDLRWFLDGPTFSSLQYTVAAVGWLGFAPSTDLPATAGRDGGG